jgi:hypothetical protein
MDALFAARRDPVAAKCCFEICVAILDDVFAERCRSRLSMQSGAAAAVANSEQQLQVPAPKHNIFSF